MLSKILKKTDVKRNLTISIIGTALAQLIHLGTTPIISRIYTPEQFGKFSLFLSFLGVATALTLWKFDLAIMAADDDEVPIFRKIFSKLASITTLFSIVITVGLYLFSIDYWYIFALLTITIPLSNKYWVHRSIINKLANFKRLSSGKVIENTSNGILAISLGLLSLKDFGLFIGKMGSLTFTWIYYRVVTSKKYLVSTQLNTKEVIQKYQNYPKFSFPAELVAQFNLNTSIFIFSYYFSAIEVGLIGLTTRVMSLPANFVSISFYDVFKQKALDDYKNDGEFRTIFVKFFIVLTSLALVMITVIYFFGPWLFEFVFGSAWSKAGIYAQYLCFFYAVRLITGPLCFSLEVVNKHYVNLVFQILYLVTGFTSIVLTYSITGSDLLCVKYYSISLAILYIIHTYISYKATKPGKN